MSVETQSCPALGLELYGQPILYKFFLSKQELVPEGIRTVERDNDRAVDRRHAEEAKAEGRSHDGMEGRVRPGRVDTGSAIYPNQASVRIGSIRSLLALQGYRVTDCHFYLKPGFGKGKDQYVIVLSLQVGGKSTTLSKETIEGLRRLARENTWTLNVWDNGNDRPSTINFTARQPNGRSERMLAIRDGFLKLTDLNGVDPYEMERAEDARISDEILNSLEAVRL